MLGRTCLLLRLLRMRAASAVQGFLTWGQVQMLRRGSHLLPLYRAPSPGVESRCSGKAVPFAAPQDEGCLRCSELPHLGASPGAQAEQSPVLAFQGRGLPWVWAPAPAQCRAVWRSARCVPVSTPGWSTWRSRLLVSCHYVCQSQRGCQTCTVTDQVPHTQLLQHLQGDLSCHYAFACEGRHLRAADQTGRPYVGLHARISVIPCTLPKGCFLPEVPCG